MAVVTLLDAVLHQERLHLRPPQRVWQAAASARTSEARHPVHCLAAGQRTHGSHLAHGKARSDKLLNCFTAPCIVIATMTK